jgi:hypothetical protein
MYNRRRRRSSIDMPSPIDYEERYWLRKGDAARAKVAAPLLGMEAEEFGVAVRGDSGQVDRPDLAEAELVCLCDRGRRVCRPRAARLLIATPPARRGGYARHDPRSAGRSRPPSP